MKVFPSAIITNLSGRLGGIVFRKEKNTLHGPTTNSARLYVNPQYSRTILQDNVRLVTELIIPDWHIMKTDAPTYATWQAQAVSESTISGIYISVYRLYIGFFLLLYSSRYTTNSRMITFNLGLGRTWANRFTRTFT